MHTYSIVIQTLSWHHHHNHRIFVIKKNPALFYLQRPIKPPNTQGRLLVEELQCVIVYDVDDRSGHGGGVASDSIHQGFEPSYRSRATMKTLKLSKKSIFPLNSWWKIRKIMADIPLIEKECSETRSVSVIPFSNRHSTWNCWRT